MYKKMLVAFDGAESSMDIVRQAARFARSENSMVDIVTVCPEYQGNLRIQGDASVLYEMYDSIRNALNDAVAMCKADGVQVRGHFLTGNPADVLAEQIEALGSDIVALGTHSSQLLHSVVIGSVAGTVVRHSDIDLLIITGDKELSVQNIFLAYDGSAEAGIAARQACALAERYGSRLTAGIAYEMDMEAFSLSPVVESAAVEKTELAVESIKNIVASADVRNFDVAVRYGNPPHEVLVEEAQKSDAGLIVIGACSRSKLSHLLVGGVVHKLVYSSACPVLIVKEQAQ
ncbi:universal stress protein [Halodesulfovibrio aestuarii]|uniref:universal stress protein n=1 Tax=Halodesulfovibrio aestuarii TaxID=126333 RepID=UPI003D33684C